MKNNPAADASRQRWHQLLFFVAFAIATVLIGGCAKQEEKPLEMRIALEAELERLDPMTIKNPKSFILAWQVFEGLLGLDDKGRIVPVLAESWETKDHRTWLFHIRKGVKFHSSELFGGPNVSREVTANDVLWSYTAYCSAGAYLSFLLTDAVQGCGEYNAGKAAAVTGYRVLDDHTFQITLLKPEPFFLNRLTTAWVAVFPKESADSRFREKWGLQSVVGTGPYRLQSRSASEYVLTANEDYWDKARLPAVKRLVYRVATNDQVRFAEYEKGNFDLMFVPSQLFPTLFQPDGLLKAEYEKRSKIKTIDLFNTNMIGINLRSVQDSHLRRAMYYGTDRRLMVQKILYGYGDVIGGAVPPGMNGYVPAYNTASLYDPHRAREELAKSGYKGEALEMDVHELANSEQIGQIFQSQMKYLGIEIKLTKLDYNSLIGRVIKGEAPLFSMFADIVFSSPEPLLINLFSSAKRPVPNFWQYSDPATDSALEALRGVSDRVESVKRAALIEARIMQDAPAIFLYRQKPIVMYDKRFGDLEVNSHGYLSFNKLRPQQ